MTEKKTRPSALLWAAAIGLLVFFALESAIARRVGLDLFLPAAAGAFLPWRAGRLVCCLGLSFLLALTGWGRALGARLRALLDKNWGCWLVAAVMTALLAGWTLRVTVLSYMISDDVTILKAIAAVPREGIQAVAHVFIHPLFGLLLGQFHRLDPDGMWYIGYNLTVMLAALCIVGRCVLLKTRRHPWPAAAGCAIFAVLYAGVFMYPLAAITFTTTAAMAGVAAVALTLTRDEISRPGLRAVSDVASVLFLLLAVLERPQAGKGVLCFWALAAGYQLLKLLLRREGRRTGAAILFGAGVLAAAALAVGLSIYSPVEEDIEYTTAEHARSIVLDIYLPSLTDEHFAAAGIPKELASLLRGWFFMDRRITTDRFFAIAEAYEKSMSGKPGPTGILARTAKLLADTAVNIVTDPQILYLFGTILVLLALCAAVYLAAGRPYWLEGLTALCAVGGTVILVLYLMYFGRMPARGFLVMALPATVTLVLMALSGPGAAEGAKHKKAARVLGGTSLGLLAVLCAVGVCLVPHTTDTATRADLFGAQWRMEAYAREHPDITIINNAYDYVYDPIHGADYPENLTWWGACGVTANDEDRIYADMFFRDDVQFIGDNYSSLLALLQYLSVEYGPVQAAVIDQLSPAIFVSDIDLADPGEDYTGWYTLNGVTYYFDGGQAVTGTRTIAGKVYTFAPAGVMSQLLATQGPDGLIWYPDAYSLTE